MYVMGNLCMIQKILAPKHFLLTLLFVGFTKNLHKLWYLITFLVIISVFYHIAIEKMMLKT